MKRAHLLISFFLIITVLFTSPETQAGFRIIHKQGVTAAPSYNSSYKEPFKNKRKYRQKQVHYYQYFGYSKKPGGWAGVLSFIFSIIMIAGICIIPGAVGYYFLVLSIPATIFGAMGNSKLKRNRGLAIAGFILGIAGVLAGLIILGGPYEEPLGGVGI